ncbi:MAG: DNA cytosine methyltransferase [Prevotella pallens]|jgi:DNA (cytosine-5-)-methyltransferase|uniref:DNA cytosine methyltransferase n=1 Tax=Prevotella pallens TaxID=60133 RepID=UPI001CB2E453|nr:DNA (cytosine-5-)-methyltransferase [Prevotella pallens]MBF1498737.1 DNA cytosine methyltransferase [Prevotella pallens]
MNEKGIKHASLFSGIGAPELAAYWLGWQNVFHCEISEFCKTILNYWYPNSIGYENIKTTDFKKWQGEIDVLTGGFPCQPFSSAGQRLGANDDRYLWPEMLRAIREIQPSFVIGENVAGILTMVQPTEAVKVGCTPSLFEENDNIYRKEQQFVVETVCTDLEREGYSVQPFVIPACSVGAPHQRDRVWFIAQRNASNSYNARTKGMQERKAEVLFSRVTTDSACSRDTAQQTYQRIEREGRSNNGQQKEWRATSERTDGLYQLSWDSTDTLCAGFQETRRELKAERIARYIQQDGLVANSDGKRWQEVYDDNGQSEGAQKAERGTEQFSGTNCPQDWWRDFPTVSPVCIGNDGLPFDVSRLTISFVRWRQEAIKALGNSMVPQVVYELFKAIESQILKD